MSKAPSIFRNIILATGLLVAVLPAGRAATAAMDEKPPLPDDLRFEPKPVPAADNGIIDWRRSAELKVALGEKEKEAIRYCWTPAARTPNDLGGLQAWLKRNQEALEIFNASLQKPRMQWPEHDPENKRPEMAMLKLMMCARLFEADQMAEQGKFAEAAKSLEESLKLTQRAVEGDATLLSYTVAGNARSLAQSAMLRLACRKQTPVSVLEEMLKNLPGLDPETNVYAHVLRVEFTHDYNESLNVKQFMEAVSKMSGTNAALYMSFYPDELQRAFRVLLDPSLVALHPKPFDANAEIARDIQTCRIYRANSLGPWSQRNGAVELKHEEERASLARDIAPLMELVKDDPLPLSRAVAQKARPAYLEIENPIGRILNTSIIEFIMSDIKVFQLRTEREAGRALLASLIFEKRKGQLPPTLASLVEEKILTSIPSDPFSGEALHYSREKRKIWSVSDNGKDDGGVGGSSRWYEKDAVWQIPELN